MHLSLHCFLETKILVPWVITPSFRTYLWEVCPILQVTSSVQVTTVAQMTKFDHHLWLYHHQCILSDADSKREDLFSLFILTLDHDIDITSLFIQNWWTHDNVSQQNPSRSRGIICIDSPFLMMNTSSENLYDVMHTTQTWTWTEGETY